MRGTLLSATRRWVTCATARSNAGACAALLAQTRSNAASTSSSGAFSFQAEPSDEMPLKGLADGIGDRFGPALDAFAKSQSRDSRDSDEPPEVYVPGVPHVLPVTRWARDNAFIREVLIYDEKKRQKPRLSWYDPYDTTWVPNGWFSDGVMADMKYYFGEKK